MSFSHSQLSSERDLCAAEHSLKDLLRCLIRFAEGEVRFAWEGAGMVMCILVPIGL